MIKLSLPILYEDDNLIAIDKPDGICSIPDGPNRRNNIQNILEDQLNQRPFIIHRLDKGVSGIMIFGKTFKGFQCLREQFSDRLVKKQYFAVVHGRVNEDQGVIDKPMHKFGSQRMGIDIERGIPSITNYYVLERFQHTSFLQLQPITGRKHQLRVHLQSIGHPVLGDRRYSDFKNHPCDRIMLHASSLTFRTVEGVEKILSSPLPKYFLEVLTKNT